MDRRKWRIIGSSKSSTTCPRRRFCYRALSYVHHAQFQIVHAHHLCGLLSKSPVPVKPRPRPGSVRVENSASMLLYRHRSTTRRMSYNLASSCPSGFVGHWGRRCALMSCWCAYPDRDLHIINKALRIYEQLHKQRAETLVDLAAANGRELHLGGGVAKEEHEMQFSACGSRY